MYNVQKSQKEGNPMEQKKTDSKLTIVFWSLKKARKICPGKLVFWLFVNVCSALLAPAYLVLSSYLIDAATSGIGMETSVVCLLLPVGSMTVFLFLRGSYGLLIQVTKQLFVNDIQMEVSREIMDQNARIPVAAFDDDEFVKMLYLCADSNNAVNVAVVAQGSITVLGQIASIATLLVMAARLSLLFLLAALALVAISTALCMWMAGTRYRIEKETIVDTRWKKYYFSCPCTQENGREIRTLGLEDFFVKKWRSVADPLRKQMLMVEHAKNNGSKLTDALSILLSMGMLIGGTWLLGGNIITLGTMYLIWQLSNELQGGIRSFANELVEPYASIPKVRDTKEYLELALENNLALCGKGDMMPSDTLAPVYQLKNVSFGYKEGKEILHQLSLTLRPGEIVALCGLNGCGKSTLINLLTGLYKTNEGSIAFAGVPFQNLTAKQLSTVMGVAFQHTCIFGFLLKEEVALGQIERLPREEEIQRAIRRGGAKKIQDRIGMDSYVGTDYDVSGYRLSGGEKQRIGVSRAFMGDKQVLVLDEPAAMLDPIAEYRQFQEIRGQIMGQTAILISHRIGFARLADRILVMEAGQIVEDGTHEELMGRGGVYRRMFEAQKEWYDDVEGEV